VSGLALCFYRDDRQASPRIVATMLSAMEYLGSDGKRVEAKGPVALGHLYFCTSPEDSEERQPLTHSEASLTLVWDGRLDNRQEVYRQLPGRLPPLPDLSDAQLVLHAYACWGSACVGRLLGPFALAVYDHSRRDVVLACDPMGGRNLFYWLSDHTLVVASEPGGVLAHPDVTVEPDHGSMAMFFAYTEQTDAATCFRGVKALLPAQIMRVGLEYVDTGSYWPFDPTARLYYRKDEDYADHFLELLTKSVECRLPATGKPAVALSGGLDSAPIAAVAARSLATQERRLIAASWVFDRFAECDEREYLQHMYRAHNVESLQVNCDAAWPLSDFDTWPIHPCAPFQNPYRRFQENLYRELEQHGVRVLLSGLMGDHLYTGTERWLRDLLAERRFSSAIGDGMWYIAEYGWRTFLRQGLLRGLTPEGIYRIVRPRPVPEWLTPFARSCLNNSDAWPQESTRARRPHQYFRALELVTGLGYIERFFAGRYRIELRYPFRDRRLVDFMLQIPTRQLYSRGTKRPIVRRAMRDLVPATILARPTKTSFQSLYTFGLCEKELTRVNQWLDSPDNLWCQYVDRDWLLADRDCERMSGYVGWLCISLEMWSRYTLVGGALRKAPKSP
jgi:asparagine synthase (glutamine-hydrolysing)